jgi:hypothetical protein
MAATIVTTRSLISSLVTIHLALCLQLHWTWCTYSRWTLSNVFAKLLLTVCQPMSGSESITSWKHCSVRRGWHSVTVRTSFAPTSVVAQCVSRCSAPTTGQAWCLLSSCCCLLLWVQKSDAVAS